MIFKYLLISILWLSLYANNTLHNVYYIDSNDVSLGTIVADANAQTILFSIAKNKHIKKIQSKQLIKILNIHGYKNYKYKSQYVSFIKKSPINTSIIKIKLQEYYKKNYEQIDIHSMEIQPRNYMTSLPNDYMVEIKSKNYLKSNGILSIKTKDRKKIFFNYKINAHVGVYTTRMDIKRKEELSAINTAKDSIIFQSFKAKPIQNLGKTSMQSKRNIKKGKLLTYRDVEVLSLVKKNEQVNVNFSRDHMSISFAATALDDGVFGQSIRVQKSNGKKIKVIVTGKNKVEIQ